MRRFLSCLILLILAWAVAPATPAAAQDASILRLEQDKGQIVKLRQAASSVFIANPDIADLQVMSPTMVYVFGKKAGETSLMAVNGNEQIVANRRITVTPNLTGLERALRERFPNRQITAQAADNAIVLSGNVANASEAEDARRIAARYVPAEQGEILNRLTITGATQIMLRVRVSEVNRSIREDFGFNWEALGSLGSNYFIGLATGVTDIVANTGTAGGLTGFTRTPDQMNALFRYKSGRWDINGLIDAMASDGLISILAEPNLVSASGETASFLAGGEFPIIVPQDNNRVTIEFKPFGVSLAFTPTMLGSDRISMRVRPEVSELDFANGIQLAQYSVPALRTRRAETTIELGSGQSFAIAGLLQNNLNESVNKFPGLGDIPVLGTLFRSSRFQRNESELVIIVTPYVVRPSSGPSHLSSPTDSFAPVPFLDRVLFGRMTQPGPGPRPPAQHKLNGPVGHVVE